PVEPTSDVGEFACLGMAGVLGVTESQYCDEQAQQTPRVTAPLVARALRRLDIPASILRVQPGNGRTLVNFDTNFFTDGDGLTRTVRLLGQRVDLRIT